MPRLNNFTCLIIFVDSISRKLQDISADFIMFKLSSHVYQLVTTIGTRESEKETSLQFCLELYNQPFLFNLIITQLLTKCCHVCVRVWWKKVTGDTYWDREDGSLLWSCSCLCLKLRSPKTKVLIQNQHKSCSYITKMDMYVLFH